MECLRVFVDESGDEHLNTASGAAKNYVLAAVIVREDDLNSVIATANSVRHRYFQTGEMKSSRIGNNLSRRCKVLQSFSESSFHVVAFCVPKERLPRDSPLRFAQVFLKYTAQKLCIHLPKRQEVEVIFDKKGRISFQDEFKTYLKERFPQNDLFHAVHFDVADSKDNVLVQLADLFAGSVAKQYMAREPELLRILSKKVTVWEWPTGRDWGLIVRCEGINQFDAVVRREAFRRAWQFMEASDAEDENVSLRQLFLKWLIDHSTEDDVEFLFSDQISLRFKNEFALTIDRQAIRNKIVGPLRDAGVLIASSSKGYRLPNAVRDIHRYVGLCNSQIPPALSRLRRAREIILSSTTGALDILVNDDALRRAVDSISPLA